MLVKYLHSFDLLYIIAIEFLLGDFMLKEMKTRIDLHNHTLLSDGTLNLFDRCHMKKNIIDTICITDHFPDFPDAYAEAKRMEKEYNKLNKGNDLPNLIIGMEYCFSNVVEVLVFGNDFINEIRKNIPRTYEDMRAITNNHKRYGMVICHPLRCDELDNHLLLSMVDGIEITLRGSYLKNLEKRFYKLKKKYNLNLFSNSDYHVGNDPENEAHSIIKGESITDENELIDALKKDLVIEHVYSDIFTY